jgi:hypothetical protein
MIGNITIHFYKQNIVKKITRTIHKPPRQSTRQRRAPGDSTGILLVVIKMNTLLSMKVVDNYKKDETLLEPKSKREEKGK